MGKSVLAGTWAAWSVARSSPRSEGAARVTQSNIELARIQLDNRGAPWPRPGLHIRDRVGRELVISQVPRWAQSEFRGAGCRAGAIRRGRGLGACVVLL